MAPRQLSVSLPTATFVGRLRGGMAFRRRLSHPVPAIKAKGPYIVNKIISSLNSTPLSYILQQACLITLRCIDR